MDASGIEDAMTPQEHIDNLVRHIGLVHDASKFHGIEWEYLHKTGEVPADRLQLAVEHHRRTNEHHPEYWGGIDNMPEIFVAEMVCDWYARSQEFGTDLRVWIRGQAS